MSCFPFFACLQGDARRSHLPNLGWHSKMERECSGYFWFALLCFIYLNCLLGCYCGATCPMTGRPGNYSCTCAEGHLPKALDWCRKCRHVDLRYKKLMILDYDFSASCYYLDEISLTGNLIATYPKQLAYFNDGTKLDLSYNLLRGDAPKTTVVNILNLSHNFITNIAPDTYLRYNVVRELDVSHNKLETLNLKCPMSLIKIDFSANKISNLYPIASDNLTTITLSRNQLTSINASMFSESRALMYLHLDGNKISSIMPDSFTKLAFLKELYLADNLITHLAPSIFTGLLQLTKLDLSFNQLGDNLPDQVFSMTWNLKNLMLRGNNMTKIKKGWIASMTFDTLQFGDNPISILPAFIFSNTTVRYLNLTSTQITGFHEYLLPRRTIDTTISLSSTRLTFIDDNARKAAKFEYKNTPFGCNSQFRANSRKSQPRHGCMVQNLRSGYVCRRDAAGPCTKTYDPREQCRLFPEYEDTTPGHEWTYRCPYPTVLKPNPCYGHAEPGSVIHHEISICNKTNHEYICACESLTAISLLGLCHAVNCSVSSPEVGGLTAAFPSNPIVGSVATLTCHKPKGFGMYTTSTCLHTGEWSTPDIRQYNCSDFHSCGNFKLSTLPSNLLVKVLGLTHGSVALYSCEEGYNIVGSNYTICSKGIWTDPHPTCMPASNQSGSVSCGQPPDLMNGQVTVNYNKSGDDVTYSCNNGYKIAGFVKGKCLENGMWSLSKPPVCTIARCPRPYFLNGHFAESNRSDSEFVYGFQLSIVCNYGYGIPGGSQTYQVTCTENSEWTPAPICQTTGNCSTPSAPVNGQIYVLSIQNGHGRVIYSCSTGYLLDGQSAASCSSQGIWIPSAPTCKPIKCPNPGKPADGVMQPNFNNYDYQSHVTFSCNMGYDLVGVSSIQCIANNLWSSRPPNCQPVKCASPTAPSNGDYTPKKFSYNYRDTVQAVCNTGFQPSSSTCNEARQWVPDLTCKLITCDDPGTPSNSVVTGGNRSYYLPRSHLSFECTIGYKLEGHSRIECIDNGTWSHDVPKCTGVTCRTPGSIYGGTSIPKLSHYPYLTNIINSCNAQFYLMSGPTKQQCSADGRWIPEVPVICKFANSCPLLPTLANSFTSLSPRQRWWYNTVVIYHCSHGYYPVGNPRIVCQLNETWSPLLLRCLPPQCLPPPDIPNARRIGNNHSVSDQVRYECNIGYQLSQPLANVLTCDFLKGLQSHWLYNDGYPRCDIVIKFCDDPGELANGKRAVQGLTYLASTTYGCDPGYRLNGESVLTCTASGNWSSKFPICVRVTCSTPSSPSNGSVVVNGNYVNHTVLYTCNTGHALFGSATARCTQQGVWVPNPPTCKPVSCKNPGNIAGSDFSSSSSTYVYQDTLQVNCRKGFKSIQSVCSRTGEWVPPAVCLSLGSCSDTSDPANGKRVVAGLGYYIGSITYTCNTGYKLHGSSVAHCRKGTWSAPVPTCIFIRCTQPVIGQNLIWQASTLGLTNNTQMTFSCSTGYTLVGNAVSTCDENSNWTTAVPTCKINECPDPGTPTDGVRIDGGKSVFQYNDQVEFRCNNRFTLNGNSKIDCRHDHTWSRSIPSCIVSECPTPVAPLNGNVAGSDFSIGSTVIYTCDHLYRHMNGSASATCTVSGTWSTPTPSCDAIKCQHPGIPLNGKRKGVDTPGETFAHSATFDYECNPGYTLTGTARVSCLASETWSASLPTCTIKSCPHPDTTVTTPLENGAYVLKSKFYQSHSSYICYPGYVLTGPAVLTCTQFGNWSYIRPSCTAMKCNQPETLSNGDFQPKKLEYIYLDNVTYLCRAPYVIVGSATSTCTADGSWSTPAPVCKSVVCPDPGQPLNGRKTSQGTSYVHLNIITYQCNIGYNIVGTDKIQCNSSGQWSGAVPFCQLKQCIDPGTPLNGSRTLTLDLDYGSKVEYSCDQGFTSTGVAHQTCSDSETWLPGGEAICTPVSCGDPGPIKNGTRDVEGFTFSQSIRYGCKPGYQLSGSTIITCTAGGTWSSSLPYCNLTMCPDLKAPKNGDRTVGGLLVNDTMNFTCAMGYIVKGSNQIVCTDQGGWSDAVPMCESVRCPPPVAPANGTVDAGDVGFGHVITYRCNYGYTLNGDAVQRCSKDATWSSSEVECEINKCPDPGWPAYGTRTVVGMVYNASITFECAQGYVLNGSSLIQCKADGSWTAAVPHCDHVGKVVSASANASQSVVGSVGVLGAILGIIVLFVVYKVAKWKLLQMAGMESNYSTSLHSFMGGRRQSFMLSGATLGVHAMEYQPVRSESPSETSGQIRHKSDLKSTPCNPSQSSHIVREDALSTDQMLLGSGASSPATPGKVTVIRNPTQCISPLGAKQKVTKPSLPGLYLNNEEARRMESSEYSVYEEPNDSLIVVTNMNEVYLNPEGKGKNGHEEMKMDHSDAGHASGVTYGSCVDDDTYGSIEEGKTKLANNEQDMYGICDDSERYGSPKGVEPKVDHPGSITRNGASQNNATDVAIYGDLDEVNIKSSTGDLLLYGNNEDSDVKSQFTSATRYCNSDARSLASGSMLYGNNEDADGKSSASNSMLYGNQDDTGSNIIPNTSMVHGRNAHTTLIPNDSFLYGQADDVDNSDAKSQLTGSILYDNGNTPSSANGSILYGNNEDAETKSVLSSSMLYGKIVDEDVRSNTGDSMLYGNQDDTGSNIIPKTSAVHGNVSSEYVIYGQADGADAKVDHIDSVIYGHTDDAKDNSALYGDAEDGLKNKSGTHGSRSATSSRFTDIVSDTYGNDVDDNNIYGGIDDLP